MKQSSFDLNLSTRRTRKQTFLQQMETVVPWAALVELIAPYYSEGRNGRPPFAPETMLRVHFMQQWFNLSDPAMEEAFFDTPLYREFAQLDAFGRLPDESTILRFRHRLEKHKLADQILARAPVSGDQAPVRIHQGALPGVEEKHVADQDAVCVVQLVDGASQIDGGAGMSASAIGQVARLRPQMGPNRAKFKGKPAPFVCNLAR